MADLFSGGAVGAVMGELLKAAIEAFKKGKEFKPTLESNIETLNSVAPLVDEMTRYNQQLDRPRHEIEDLQKQIREGEELARKCQKLSRWKFLSFPHYQGKLQAKDESLRRYMSFDVQAQNARHLMEVLLKVREIVEILGKENFGQYQQINGLRGAPEEPKCLGMDERLSKLKVELLKDDVSVLVLTGLGGSGKSTLAKKICWDPQVKGKFRTNIFFVTFSETPNVKNIVKTLFENCGCQVPEFQNDEDAINRLGILMRLVGRNPILLVLDDVWPKSETLVEKFKFQIPGYKILVTSRVAFRRFGTPCPLEALGHDEAVSLFCHFAQLTGSSSSSYKPDQRLVNEIVKGCKGSPLALEVIGGSLSQQPFEMWENMKEKLQSQSILESSITDLLFRLQQSLDILEDKFSVNEKECFMDLGLFPEDQRIPVTTLIDMWAELHNLDENGRNAMTIVHDLTTRNLIKLIVTRKVANDTDMYYNNHFVMLHDLLRKLAIVQSTKDPFEQRKKLNIELNGAERPDWWVVQNQNQNQQGILNRMMSLLARKPKQLRVAAQILSISTDEDFASDWCDMQPDEAEVLILNIRSSHYSLPQFTEKMSKLKVLIVTNYGFHRSELNNFDLLTFLSDLKRIRLEKVSVPCLCILKNLQKLSLHMCNTKQAFENSNVKISDAMPNLVEMSIDYCKDVVKLPDEICNITPLKKLSITNCHKLSSLPQDIAKLKNLELLRLSSCSDLKEMPESVGGLNKLRCLDISDCVSLANLPEDIGELKTLEKLYMKGCSALSELPYSVKDFVHLKDELHVICDEERAVLWEIVSDNRKLKIETTRVEASLNWLHGVRS